MTRYAGMAWHSMNHEKRARFAPACADGRGLIVYYYASGSTWQYSRWSASGLTKTGQGAGPGRAHAPARLEGRTPWAPRVQHEVLRHYIKKNDPWTTTPALSCRLRGFKDYCCS